MDSMTTFDAGTIDALSIDELAIAQKIAGELGVRLSQVQAVLSLAAEGSTVPFISRYRKERTGNLDEVQVRDCIQKFESNRNLEERRLEVLKGVSALGKLDAFLYEKSERGDAHRAGGPLGALQEKEEDARHARAGKGARRWQTSWRQRRSRRSCGGASFIRSDEEHPEPLSRTRMSALAALATFWPSGSRRILKFAPM